MTPDQRKKLIDAMDTASKLLAPEYVGFAHHLRIKYARELVKDDDINIENDVACNSVEGCIRFNDAGL